MPSNRQDSQDEREKEKEAGVSCVSKKRRENTSEILSYTGGWMDRPVSAFPTTTPCNALLVPQNKKDVEAKQTQKNSDCLFFFFFFKTADPLPWRC